MALVVPFLANAQASGNTNGKPGSVEGTSFGLFSLLMGTILVGNRVGTVRYYAQLQRRLRDRAIERYLRREGMKYDA